MSKLPYYKKLKEFRQTDIRYVGAGGFQIAKKEFGMNMETKLKENPWNIPNKDKIYLEYIDQRYKKDREKEKESKNRREKVKEEMPDIYSQYRDDLLSLKYKYFNKGLEIKPIPKEWPGKILIEEEIEKKKMEEKEEIKETKMEEKEEIKETKMPEIGEEEYNLSIFGFKNQPRKSKSQFQFKYLFYEYNNLGPIKSTSFMINGEEYVIFSDTSNMKYRVKKKVGPGQYESVEAFPGEIKTYVSTTTNFKNVLIWLKQNNARHIP